MDKIKIDLGSDEISCNKMIATVKNDQHNNMLEQFVAGSWTLEELITAKSNFAKLLEEQIYKSLAAPEQSLLDNIQEKQQAMEENLKESLTTEERELYQKLYPLSYSESIKYQAQNKSAANNSKQDQQNSAATTKDKVVNLNEYRKNK